MNQMKLNASTLANSLRNFAAAASELADVLESKEFCSSDPGSTIQKVEIVVTMAEEPSRIAREVRKMLEALKSHPPGAT